ncbi:NTF2 fold immunity protein [Chryseobacterium paridis]|uniref:NTF2 fold domain-containing protein n=1 Tax=Chryseobacterium paridis TaxID=2800328 RepID=A0ABS1FYG5_9FLAO|nr:NTF2 fold immunity protein [Chryseobacterium paridis]MBK1897503.1 hypothetical protein [Chryseobacterium paridis]
MKYYIFTLAALFSCTKHGISNKETSSITDKEIALTVAEKKWNEVYGKTAINKQKPFIAEKKNDSTWVVHGTFPKPTIGGVAYAEVNIKTQKVVSYTHGE